MNRPERNLVGWMLWLGLGLLANRLALAEPPAGPQPMCRAVGFRVIDLPFPQGSPLTVAVWYPTAAAPVQHLYGGTARGMVAVDGEPLVPPASVPLFLFSHGYGGCGLSASYLCEALAARGWIVAAPDHHDRHSVARIRGGAAAALDRKAFLAHAGEIARSNPDRRGPFLYRLDEIKAVLDGILAADPFGRFIDRQQIAVGGHSFGGFTVLGLCGTIPERRDPRIRAVLLLSSGAAGYLYNDSELAMVQVPVMYFLGEREKGQKRGEKTMDALAKKILKSLTVPWYFLEIACGTHFSFNTCLADTLAARFFFSGSEDQFEVIRRYAVAFLEKHVAGNPRADQVLARPDPLLTRFERRPAP